MPKTMLAQMQEKLVDWNLADPRGKPIEEGRKIIDRIERKVVALSKKNRGQHKHSLSPPPEPGRTPRQRHASRDQRPSE